LQQVKGKSILDIIDKPYQKAYKELTKNIFKGKSGIMEFEITGLKGTHRWMETHAVSLKNTEGKIISLLGVTHDITERKKTEEALEKRAAELLASNTELEHFAYVASHDLQEPLRMVISFMNLLEKRMDGQLDETNKQYIHFAVDGAKRMKTLIQDLLLYSRVGTNKENFAATDLNEVMQYTTQLLKENIKKNRAVITVKPMPVIWANKTLISQLFVNLVSNALKYHGDKEPEIEVGCTEEPGKWIFYVKDNGIGIDPKFFDKIFIMFQRLHNKNEYSGTGIGLAICKKIVETHKGRIWVESEAGKGSTFYFSIPKQNVMNKNKFINT
ncbi:MAG TPA: ATP-binding protein, partial [Hanamia sp.]